LPRRTWTRHTFAATLRGVAYFGERAAILTAKQLLLYDLAASGIVSEYPVEAGDGCELLAFLGGRVLLVPCKDGRGLFLGLRDEQLVVLGVLEGRRWTGGSTVDGRSFLKLEQPGYLEVHNLEQALRAAPVLG